MLLALVGPTASGKSDAGVAIARRMGAEIVSIDSMLVYRGMDIGTAKPSAEERASVPHHLIDLANPSERFTVARFQVEAREVLRDIHSRARSPLFVGGSGLYYRAVVDDLAFPPEDGSVREELEREADSLGAQAMYARLRASDPVAAARIEPGNVRRVVRALEVERLTGRRFSTFAAAWGTYEPERVRAAGVRISGEDLAVRVDARVRAMLDRGLLDEVRGLMASGFGGWLTSTQAIGYAEVVGHLEGRSTIEEATALTVKRTKELARRQMAWFRKDPRIRWFDAGPEGAIALIDRVQEYLRT